MIDQTGSTCDKIGVSYSAFDKQENRCHSPLNRCHHTMIIWLIIFAYRPVTDPIILIPLTWKMVSKCYENIEMIAVMFRCILLTDDHKPLSSYLLLAYLQLFKKFDSGYVAEWYGKYFHKLLWQNWMHSKKHLLYLYTIWFHNIVEKHSTWE